MYTRGLERIVVLTREGNLERELRDVNRVGTEFRLNSLDKTRNIEYLLV